MPRFYFHLINDVDAPDAEGREFADLAAARSYAVTAARDMMAETMREDGSITLSHRIDVEDENHLAVASVQYGDAVTVCP